jgi:hypothetical protein
MNDMLTTLLRDAAEHETLPPAPAAHVRRHAEKVRARRRAGAAAFGIAVAVAGGVVAQGALTSATWFTTTIAPALGEHRSGRGLPAPTTTERAAPSPTATPSATPSAEGTDDTTGSNLVGTQTPWPAPPTSYAQRPWTLPGFDAGRIVAARMEDGHAVITVDRIQLYSREQWKAKTGEVTDMDFRSLNESTRTRQFVIEDDALIYVNWQYDENQGPVKLTPQAFVDRTDKVLLEQANLTATGRPKYPDDTFSTPSVGIILFHRDGLDGPVAYLEDSAVYTG